MVQFYKAKKSSSPRKKFEITATELDQFGQGVGHHQGKACFVPGLLPGEKGEVSVTEEKRNFIRGELKRIITTSPERREPPCAIYQQCGGCQQQHISESLQQKSKAAALSRLLSSSAEIAVESILSGDSWHYRRRARLSLRTDRQGMLTMGFRRKNNDEIVAVTDCPVLVQNLNDLLIPLQQCLQQLQGVKHLGHVELVAADNQIVIILRHLRQLSANDRQKLEQFSHTHQVTLFLTDEERQTLLKGEMPWYGIEQLKLYFNPQGFIQVNAEVNRQMVDKAIDWLAVKPDDRILDLFCGVGNFTLPLAKLAKSVIGVEGLAELVAKAEYNAQQNEITNAAFYQHNLEEDVSYQPWAKAGFTKVLLDPARAGALHIMSYICRLKPECIVYVSCNPATLARDSEVAFKAGYRMVQVAMLDMFPHTGHLESMVLFESS